MSESLTDHSYTHAVGFWQHFLDLLGRVLPFLVGGAPRALCGVSLVCGDKCPQCVVESGTQEPPECPVCTARGGFLR